jgi:membrane-associated phospholipid phosphatase
MTRFTYEANWLAQVAFRVRSHWVLKLLGTVICLTLFLVVYFLLLRHPVFPVTVMTLSSLDRLISFQPWSLVLYASLWLYISLVPLLLHTRSELLPYLSAITLLSIVGFGIFFFWPTTIPKPNIDWAQYPGIDFLKSVDSSGNACPSLHVAFAVLSCIWLHRLLKQFGAPIILLVLNICWCVGIVYSTLATKQHVAIDVEMGLLLGITIAIVHLFLFPRVCARLEN